MSPGLVVYQPKRTQDVSTPSESENMHTAGNVHMEPGRQSRLLQATIRFANAHFGHPDLNSIISFDATIYDSHRLEFR